MKRLFALTILMLSSFSMFGWSYMSPQGEWYHRRYTVKWNLGHVNDDYYIRMGLFEFAVQGDVVQLNDRFAIKTKDGDLSVVVTEEILAQKEVDGFMTFPLNLSDMKRISKGVRNFLLIRNDEVKFGFREWDYDMMRKMAKSVLKSKEIAPKKIYSQDVYPSWRD